MSKAYASNLTSDQWELLEPLIPAKPGGRPREVEIGTSSTPYFTFIRRLPLAFFTGWFPAWQTVYTYFRNWRIDGTWVSIRPPARVGARRQRARGKSLRSDCGQPECKTAAMVAEAAATQPNRLGAQTSPHGWYLGSGVAGICERSECERKGAKRVLKRVKRMGKAVSRVHTVDGGYDGTPFLIWVMDVCRWIVQVVLRPEQTKGFVLLKSVGSSSARSAGWWGRADWLDYELLPQTSETFIYLAMIRLMVKRLA